MRCLRVHGNRDATNGCFQGPIQYDVDRPIVISGLPVSRYIRNRWLADLVYLTMKPLEIAFSIALLLLDRGSPEARIDRMYR